MLTTDEVLGGSDAAPDRIENATTPSNPTPAPALRVDVVSIEGSAANVSDALRTLNVVPKTYASPEAWSQNHSTSRSKQASSPEADLVVLVGSAQGVASSGLVDRATSSDRHSADVLAVITQADVPSVARLLRQGARTFVEATPSVEELASGMRWLVEKLAAQSAKRRQAIRHRDNLALLTQAEQDVLRLMLLGQTNKQVAQELEIGLRTVELRRSKIMKKMEATTVAQLLWFVHQSGFDVVN